MQVIMGGTNGSHSMHGGYRACLVDDTPYPHESRAIHCSCLMHATEQWNGVLPVHLNELDPTVSRVGSRWRAVSHIHIGNRSIIAARIRPVNACASPLGGALQCLQNSSPLVLPVPRIGVYALPWFPLSVTLSTFLQLYSSALLYCCMEYDRVCMMRHVSFSPEVACKSW